jgi:membrane-associated phospholipid phosphatase
VTTRATVTRLRRFLADRLDPKVYLGLHVTVSLALCALAVWVFGALVDSVLENESIVRWDIAAAAWIHAHVTTFGTRVFEGITDLGSPLVVWLLVLAMVSWCWRRGERVLAIGVASIVAGEVILDYVLKNVIHRTRPAFGAHFLHGLSYSFPSGHAFGGIVVYGLLAFLLVDFYRPERNARRLVWSVAGALIFAIGLSRTYLGVHYPSDVIGGWAAGVAWLAICLVGLRFARARSGHGAAGSPLSE